mmetsp:Transcript_13547/g.21621  ORF Transcript_13547/g.21621 Transcript_13547/m.21621 type:complete len:229 (+) Transcript_13547:647-1333(+)
MQRADLGKIQTFHRQRLTLWPMQRKSNGMPHIRWPHMRHQRAIVESHQRMHQRFRVHQHFNLLMRTAKKFFGFNNLQRLIEHRGTVHGDPLSHIPIGMATGLLRRSPCHIFKRPIAERAATRGDNDPLHRSHILADQPLKHRRMLTVYWKDTRIEFFCCPHNQPPGCDQRFLVGQSQCRALLQCNQPRRQTGSANNRAHHPIRWPRCGLADRRRTSGNLDTTALQRVT